MPNLQYVLYRYYNEDGTSKDWAVRSNGDGTYTSRWGKTGVRLQSKTFQNMMPMQDHINDKLGKGYKYIGEVFIDDEGKISNDIPLAPPVRTTDVPRIYWRIRMPSSLTNGPHIPFLTGLTSGFAKVLFEEYPDCTWIEEIVNDHGALIQNNAGSFTKEHGVAPLLLLLALKKKTSGDIRISLSHEDGNEISSNLRLEAEALAFFDNDLGSIREIAEKVDLIDQRVDLSQVASEQEGFYF